MSMPISAGQGDDLSCLARIEQAHPSLPVTAQQVADYVLQHADECVGLSITDLAGRAGVSETTVLRFVRVLGYQGYRRFALALASALAPSADRQLEVNIEDGDDLPMLMQKVFAAEAQALASAWHTIETAQWLEAVRVLSCARRVLCLAVGGSGLMAMEAVHRFVGLGIDCFAIVDPIQIAIQTGRLKSGDVAIGFSQTGRTRDTVEGLRIARSAGATTIGVTSRPRSPIVSASDIALVLLERRAAYRGAYLDSKIAELTLVDALCTCLARQMAQPPLQDTELLNASIDRMFLKDTRDTPRDRSVD